MDERKPSAIRVLSEKTRQVEAKYKNGGRPKMRNRKASMGQKGKATKDSFASGHSRRDLLLGSAAVLLASTVPSTAAEMPATNASTQLHSGDKRMDTITTKDGVTIFYKDWGTGQPMVFSHGWPLAADDWDAQMT